MGPDKFHGLQKLLLCKVNDKHEKRSNAKKIFQVIKFIAINFCLMALKLFKYIHHLEAYFRLAGL